MGTNRKTHSQALSRAWETLDHAALHGVSLLNPSPSELQESHRRGDRECPRARRDGAHQEEGLSINMSKAHTNSWRLKSHAQVCTGLRQALCMYTVTSSLVLLWDSWVCKCVDLWLLRLLLGSFSFICLSCSTSRWLFLFLSYCSFLLFF